MFTIVIPTYTANLELEEMAVRCATSYRPFCDNLIICEDGMNYSERLKELADVYIYNKLNVGFTKNVNRGWRYAQGDYVGIVSSDTYLLSGNPRDLCIPDKVTSPMIGNQEISNLAGPFWVTPKNITEKLGYLIEGMKTYYSDTEYDERVKNYFQKVPSVTIHHLGAQSVTAAGVAGNMDADKEVYDTLSK
jgi:hypothetical protein